jgi:hypothetical protein
VDVHDNKISDDVDVRRLGRTIKDEIMRDINRITKFTIGQ